MAFKDDLPALAQKFAPILYFHPDETYLPTSVSWYMARVQYVQSDGNILQPGQWSFLAAPRITQVDGLANEYMQIPGDDGVSVNPPPQVMAIRAGSVADAQVYVHARDVPGQTNQVDLQYWIFYAFNGAEYLHVESFYSSADADFPLSFHEGDWECVTVRVDDQNNIIGVRLSEHSWGTWFTQSQNDDPTGGYQVNGGHVVVYAARGSHANYPAPGGPYLIGGVDKFGYEIGLVDYTGQGIQVNYSASNRCVVVKNDAGNLFTYQPPASAAAWLPFMGNWGPTRMALT